jgi:predicted tellurium resistance membrane protein TerC
MLIPIPVAIHCGVIQTALWSFAAAIVIGIVGAIRLRRGRLAMMGMFLPFMSAMWTFVAFEGLFIAWKMARSGQKVKLTWEPPKRTTVLEAPAAS